MREWLVMPVDAARLQTIVDEANAGDAIVFAAGTYRTQLLVKRDLVLRGEGDVTLDGGGQRTPITIAAPIDVTIDHLTLRHGVATQGTGGNLHIHEARAVTLRDVAIVDGDAGRGACGGIYVRRGELRATQCRFERNRGGNAQAIFAQGPCDVALHRCDIYDNVGAAPAMRAVGDVRITLVDSHFRNAHGAAFELGAHAGDVPTVQSSGSSFDPPVQ